MRNWRWFSSVVNGLIWVAVFGVAFFLVVTAFDHFRADHVLLRTDEYLGLPPISQAPDTGASQDEVSSNIVGASDNLRVVSGASAKVFYVLSNGALFRISEDAGDPEDIGKRFSYSPTLDLQIVPGVLGTHVLFVKTSDSLFRSDDEGKVWRNITPPASNGAVLVSFAVNGEAKSPFLVVATRSELYISRNGGQTWDSVATDIKRHAPFNAIAVVRGVKGTSVFVASSDGLLSLESPQAINSVISKFEGENVLGTWAGPAGLDGNQVVYVVTRGWVSRIPYLRALLSIPSLWRSSDLGASWERVAWPLTFNRYNLLRYLEVFDRRTQKWHSLHVSAADGGMVISKDNGHSWQRVVTSGAPENILAAASFPVVSVIESADSEAQAIGYGVSHGSRLFAYDLGRNLWSSVKLTLPTAWIRKVAVGKDSTAGTSIFAVSNARLVVSSDFGQSWTGIKDLPNDTQATTVVVSPSYEKDETIYVGTESGLFSYHLGNARWIGFEQLNNRTITAVFDPPASFPMRPLVVGTTKGIVRSEDRGEEWEDAMTGIGSVYINCIIGLPDARILAGTKRGLFVSTDGGNSWDRIGGRLPPISVLALGTWGNKGSPRKILAGTANGAYLSKDGGVEWRKLTLPSGSLTVSAVLVGPSEDGEQAIYLGTVGAGILQSKDDGLTWHEVSESQERLQVWDLAALGPDPQNLVVGTVNRGVKVLRLSHTR